MTAFPTYATGTITVTAEATSSVGTGTFWAEPDVMPGDELVVEIANVAYSVILLDVTDTTHITHPKWPGPSSSGAVAYKIFKTSPQRYDGFTVTTWVDQILSLMRSTAVRLYNFVRAATRPAAITSFGEGYWIKTVSATAWEVYFFDGTFDILVGTFNPTAHTWSTSAASSGIGVHGDDIASAATVDLESATGDLVDVTGTVAITAITLSEGHERVVRFTGALALTHGGSLGLPGNANITTAANDFAIFRGYAAGVVRCVAYTKANGKSVIGPAAADITDSGAAGRAALQSATNAALQVAIGVRKVLTGNLTLYFSNAGNDTTGDGSVGNPYLTKQKCFNYIQASLDVAGYVATIQGLNETTTGNLSLSGWTGAGTITLDHAGGTISTTSQGCIVTSGVLPGLFKYQNVRLQTTTSGDCVNHSAVGRITQGDGVTFGNCAGNAHVTAGAPGAFWNTLANYIIDGNAYRHYFAAAAGAFISVQVSTISFTKGKKTINVFANTLAPGYIRIGEGAKYVGQSCTISSANPGVVTQTGHLLAANDPVIFSTDGTLPGGGTLVAGVCYFAKTIVDANNITVSATAGGAEISTAGGAGSGSHTMLSSSGQRYNVATGGTIASITGANQFPGSSAGAGGTTTGGGIYQ